MTMEHLVNKLREHADDLHSVVGFNNYACTMSLAADEIVKLREYAAMMEEDMIATIAQRDALQLRIDELTKGRKEMTREEIIRLAEEAGITVIGEAVWRLCELVAAAEREACAKLAESPIHRHEIAAGIRERGQQ